LEARRYVGRKFLVAGKSGLNLTNAESIETFQDRYSGPKERWSQLLGDFDNTALRAWAGELGFETFVSAGGKVFPKPMKAGPLLRAWMQRLAGLGVSFRFNSRIISIEQGNLTLEGGEKLFFDAAVLAFGGGSWPATGSDGFWRDMFNHQLSIGIAPFVPANCGWMVDWPESLLAEAEGLPLKNIVARCEDSSQKPIRVAGELLITRHGLEGGPIYHLGPVLRAVAKPVLVLDLKPDLSPDEVKDRLSTVRKNFVREAQRRLHLSDAAVALLRHLPNLGPWRDNQVLAGAIKHCQIPLQGPRPLEEAISTAGGVLWEELDENLMLKKLPGVFLAGEMIDWEAPTGGFLLQGCFATGKRAALGALAFVSGR